MCIFTLYRNASILWRLANRIIEQESETGNTSTIDRLTENHIYCPLEATKPSVSLCAFMTIRGVTREEVVGIWAPMPEDLPALRAPPSKWNDTLYSGVYGELPNWASIIPLWRIGALPRNSLLILKSLARPLKKIITFKGTSHDFCWSGKPMHHLQKQRKIQKTNNKIPLKLMKIARENWWKRGFWEVSFLGVL